MFSGPRIWYSTRILQILVLAGPSTKPAGRMLMLTWSLGLAEKGSVALSLSVPGYSWSSECASGLVLLGFGVRTSNIESER